MFLFLLIGRILQRKGYKGTGVCSSFRACQRNVSFFDLLSSLHMELERSERMALAAGQMVKAEYTV